MIYISDVCVCARVAQVIIFTIDNAYWYSLSARLGIFFHCISHDEKWNVHRCCRIKPKNPTTDIHKHITLYIYARNAVASVLPLLLLFWHVTIQA